MSLSLDKIMRGNPYLRAVALTFDDGPHLNRTPRLLRILEQQRVQATFFVVGKQALKFPHLVRAIHDAGHTLGNHSFTHRRLISLPPAIVRAEWRLCNRAVELITGYRMRFCRPPGGDCNRKVIEMARAEGLTTVLWTVAPKDYRTPQGALIEARVLERVVNGAIILLHDGILPMLEVLPRMLIKLRARGYEFYTMEQVEASLYLLLL